MFDTFFKIPNQFQLQWWTFRLGLKTSCARFLVFYSVKIRWNRSKLLCLRSDLLQMSHFSLASARACLASPWRGGAPLDGRQAPGPGRALNGAGGAVEGPQSAGVAGVGVFWVCRCRPARSALGDRPAPAGAQGVWGRGWGPAERGGCRRGGGWGWVTHPDS